MRPDEFKKLFDADKIAKLSSGIVKDVVYYLGNKGICNEDIPRFVPFINDYLTTLTNHNKSIDHKKELKKIIDESALAIGIEILAEPRREEHAVVKQHRRMDSLARVLALSETDTPCIAVAFVESKVMMSFNSPINGDVDQVKKLLALKFGIVRQFLTTGSQLSAEGRLDEVMNLIKMARKQILESGSHSQMLLPAEKRKRANMNKFLDVALGKLLTAVLKSPENGGFSDADRAAILIGDVEFLAPNRDIEQAMKASFHAEQVIAANVSKNIHDDRCVYVGISKLCCAACRDVLDDNPDVMFRGSHGMTFPNVIDTRNMRSMKYGTRTKMTGLSHADDSDSEPEKHDFQTSHSQQHKLAHTGRLFSTHANDVTFPAEENNENLPQGGIIGIVK